MIITRLNFYLMKLRFFTSIIFFIVSIRYFFMNRNFIIVYFIWRVIIYVIILNKYKSKMVIWLYLFKIIIYVIILNKYNHITILLLYLEILTIIFLVILLYVIFLSGLNMRVLFIFLCIIVGEAILGLRLLVLNSRHQSKELQCLNL